MEEIDQKEVVEIFDRFINEYGLWQKFIGWIKEQGYEPEELGFKD